MYIPQSAGPPPPILYDLVVFRDPPYPVGDERWFALLHVPNRCRRIPRTIIRGFRNLKHRKISETTLPARQRLTHTCPSWQRDYHLILRTTLIFIFIIIWLYLILATCKFSTALVSAPTPPSSSPPSEAVENPPRTMTEPGQWTNRRPARG